jgi:GT2 family glycosyltransferase
MIAICALGWNKAEFTQRWLESVQRNSGGHTYGLFLMDNGSTDGGETSRVMQSFKPVVFERNEGNESIYRGWNRLSMQALKMGADIIILSNNDLMVGPGWLDPVARELQSGVKRYFLPNGDVLPDDENMRVNAAANVGKTLRADAGWCLMFHRDAIPLWHPIPEELQLWYGDNWIHKKLREAGYSCETLMDCCIHHYTSTSCNVRPGLAEIVAKDREIYNHLTGENL